MTDAEEQLTRDVFAWYASHWGLPETPLPLDRVRFAEPGHDDEYEPDTFRPSRERWLRAALYAPLFGLALSAAVLSWAGWFGPASFLLLALVAALVWFFPVLVASLGERFICVSYGPGLERDLAHQVALAHYNAHPLRDCLHAFIDALLFPLAISWQEGLAAWFAARYLEQRGAAEEPGLVPLRARNGRRLAWLIARIGGRPALGFLLRHC